MYRLQVIRGVMEKQVEKDKMTIQEDAKDQARSKGILSFKLRVLIFGLHFGFLLFAIVGYSFCLWRFSGYLLSFV
jgi:hypothetical protein